MTVIVCVLLPRFVFVCIFRNSAPPPPVNPHTTDTELLAGVPAPPCCVLPNWFVSPPPDQSEASSEAPRLEVGEYHGYMSSASTENCGDFVTDYLRHHDGPDMHEASACETALVRRRRPGSRQKHRQYHSGKRVGGGGSKWVPSITKAKREEMLMLSLKIPC